MPSNNVWAEFINNDLREQLDEAEIHGITCNVVHPQIEAIMGRNGSGDDYLKTLTPLQHLLALGCLRNEFLAIALSEMEVLDPVEGEMVRLATTPKEVDRMISFAMMLAFAVFNELAPKLETNPVVDNLEELLGAAELMRDYIAGQSRPPPFMIDVGYALGKYGL